jgi:hypothetical protein
VDERLSRENPFPGMNPYLDQCWGDFLGRLTVYTRDRLHRLLPEGLRARIEEWAPDIRSFDHEPVTLRSIVISDYCARAQPLTVIEYLTPLHWLHDYRNCFSSRRRAWTKTGANLILINLFRVRETSDVERPPGRNVSARAFPWFFFSIRWGASRREPPFSSPQDRTITVGLRDRLPVIPVPLRRTDAEFRLDLQSLVNDCYESGDYGRDIDYRLEPLPPLQGDDTVWADAPLRERGCR